MLINISQIGHIPYLPLMAPARHADSLIERAQHWLQQHMADAVTMPELASALAVSDRTLARRFSSAAGTTPLGYLQAVRLDAARTLLGSR